MIDPKKTHLPPKVFISYSWTTPEHEEFVLELATRLRNDGIDIVLDKWELQPGQDKYSFMEEMVKSEDIKKVLLICDKKYKEKADDKKGGVGTESQIISPEIYKNVKQEKFIPIVTERDDNNEPYLPIFINSRIYFDLSDETKFGNEYERLLRNLLNQPLYKKPPLGVPPATVFEDRNLLKPQIIKQKLLNTINKVEKRPNALLKEFLDSILEALKGYYINKSDDGIPYDDKIFNSIKAMVPLRDDFIEFTNELIENTDSADYLNLYINFFEKLFEFSEPPETITSWTESDFDNFSFFIRELVIYFISLLYLNEKYSVINDFLNTTFFIKTRQYHNPQEENFSAFCFTVRSLDETRKTRLNLRQFSLSAELQIQNLNPLVNKNLYISIDLLLHYFSIFFSMGYWFPFTYVYMPDGTIPIYFQKIKSERHFNYLKEILNIKTKEEFIEIIKNYKQEKGYSGAFHNHIPNPNNILKTDEIAKYK